jgi:hypothetical protein
MAVPERSGRDAPRHQSFCLPMGFDGVRLVGRDEVRRPRPRQAGLLTQKTNNSKNTGRASFIHGTLGWQLLATSTQAFRKGGQIGWVLLLMYCKSSELKILQLY